MLDLLDLARLGETELRQLAAGGVLVIALRRPVA
jgi:hypothetical protein